MIVVESLFVILPKITAAISFLIINHVGTTYEYYMFVLVRHVVSWLCSLWDVHSNPRLPWTKFCTSHSVNLQASFWFFNSHSKLTNLEHDGEKSELGKKYYFMIALRYALFLSKNCPLQLIKTVTSNKE